MSSRFSNVEYAPKGNMCHKMSCYIKDDSANKLNLMFVPMNIDWNCHRIATRTILNDDTLNKQLVPTLGLPSFNELVTNIILGKCNVAVLEGRAFSVQTLGGSGGIRIAAEVFKSHYHCDTVYISKDVCFVYSLIYSYLKYDVQCLPMATDDCSKFDFYNYIDALKQAKENSVLVLYSSAADPHCLPVSHDQWKVIAQIIIERQLRPFIDCAFIGFESGDMDADAWMPRYFTSIGIEIICGYSFTKTFGIYSQRTGALTFVFKDEKRVPEMKNGVSMCIRGIYSNPPCLGARVISLVFNNDMLMDEFKSYVRSEYERLIDMRRKVREYLEQLGTPGDFTCITKQKGSFLYYKFTELQTEFLKKRYHLYMHPNSLDLCGFTKENYKYICTCIHDALLDDTFKMKRLTFVEP